jgi:hypothetical protein
VDTTPAPSPSKPSRRPAALPAPLALLAALLPALLLAACAACTTPPEPGADGGTPEADGGTGGPVYARPEDRRDAERAAVLAPGGKQALPALRDALAAAGIGVRALSDGRVLLAPAAPAQGLALAEHDPEALALLQEGGSRVSLAELGASLATLLPGTDGARLADAMLADLRAHASGDVPTLRSWARLVHELGLKGPAPYALLGDATAEQVMLDPVQRTLVVLRLSGDLAAYAKRHGADLGLKGQGLSSAASAASASSAAAAAAAAPCTFIGTEGTIMDAAAIGVTTGFGKLLEVLDAAGYGAAERAGAVLGVVNIALAYAKLGFSMIVFRFDMELDTARVTRTQSLYQAGEGPYTAKGRVSFDFGKGAQILNCLRLAFASMGIDASIPNAGPVEGSNVRWKLDGVEGTFGPDRYLDILEYLPGEEVLHDKTDAAGEASVRFVGRKQRRELGSAPLPVMKPGRVTAITEIKSANVGGDLVDAVGTALGLVTAGVTIVPELVNRMWPLSGYVDFPIQDWEPNSRATYGFAWVDREWHPAGPTSYGSYSVTPLFDTSKVTIALGEDTRGLLQYRASGKGTYVGVKGPIDEKDWCVGAWSGSWTQTLMISDVRREADGSLSMDVTVGAAEEGDDAVAIDEAACEPLSDADLPWRYAGGIFNEPESGRLVLPPGVEVFSGTDVDPHFGSTMTASLNLTGMLPRR